MSSFRPAFCGLLPHPPIIVPEVGGDRLRDCRATYDACRDFAQRLVASRPRRLFMVSPHSPRRSNAFGLWSGDLLRGDLGQFGAPGASVDLPNDLEQIEALKRDAVLEEISFWSIPTEPLDHGAVVPLWFLTQAGWDGPTTIASLPWKISQEKLEALGRAAASVLSRLGDPAALVASGDMSHRLKPDAPGGYHPRAIEFDEALTGLLAKGQLDQIASIDPEVRELAGEDAADSSLIVASAIGFEARGAEVISYEAPFGVGYLVAVMDGGG